MEPPPMVLLSTPRRMRYRLTLALLESRRAHSVPELVEVLVRQGWELHGRPSKVVSDALRAEVRRGRVVRVSRGIYRAGVVPRGTEWWIRTWLRDDERWRATWVA